VVRGHVASRPDFTEAMTDTLVSRRQRERVPPRKITRVKAPDGSGAIHRASNRVRVNRRRALIIGTYFGTVVDPNLDPEGDTILVSTGTRRLHIMRTGFTTFRYRARLYDNMIQRNQAGGEVFKQWVLRGSLQ